MFGLVIKNDKEFSVDYKDAQDGFRVHRGKMSHSVWQWIGNEAVLHQFVAGFLASPSMNLIDACIDQGVKGVVALHAMSSVKTTMKAVKLPIHHVFQQREPNLQTI